MFSSKPTVINSIKDDFFGHYDKIEFIKQFIEDNIEEGGFLTTEYDRMIALYGGRGSGKSTIMKTLCESDELQLDKNKIKPIIFEAWRYEGDDNLPLSLFHFLGREICGGIIGWEESITMQKKIRAGISGLISGFGASSGVSIPNIGNMTLSFSASGAIAREKELLNKYRDEIENNEIYQKSYFEKIEDMKGGFEKLSELRQDSDDFKEKKVIVFIDDLDRCESENVIELLTAIKLFFTYAQDIVFVVGVDKSAVTRALKSKYNNDEEKAEEYLEKIFPINFTCDVIQSVESLIEGSGIENEKLIEQIKELVEVIEFTNPRHLQRYLNKWKLVEGIWQSKVNNDCKDYEIFLYCRYAYLFEFERELFEKTTSFDPKISSYMNIFINPQKEETRYSPQVEARLSRIDLTKYLSVVNKRIYLLPFPVMGKTISDYVFSEGVNNQSFLKSIRSIGFGNSKENKIFDHCLSLENNEVQSIDFKAIITTIQIIF